MKWVMLYAFVLIIFIVGCTKSGAGMTSNTPPVGDTSLIDSTQMLVLSGTLIPNMWESANGVVKVYKKAGIYSIALEDFTSANGPDLHLYLAQESTPVHIIDMGKLKSFTGNQIYTIKGSPDFSKYKFATIHCQQYNVVFGYAPLN